MQIAKALEEKELDKDENWIAFEQSQLGDTTNYTEWVTLYQTFTMRGIIWVFLCSSEELAQKLQALEESAMEMTRE